MLLYRYEVERDSYLRIWTIVCLKYTVVKETPCGFWIGQIYANGEIRKDKFILGGQGKRYAHTTEEYALNYFIARKYRRVHFAEIAVEREKSGLEQAIALREKNKENESVPLAF